jgi:hypothetical protein
MPTRLPRPWSFGPLLLLACAQPPDISDDIETYASLLTDARFQSCNCPQLLGFADSIQCDEALGQVGTGERQCFATVLKGHEEAAREYLTCANAAYQVYVDCLETNVDCEQGIYDDCTADHEDALASCPLMPVDTQSAFEACAD